jgi:AcrR family transcriptional regulator
MRHCRLPWTCCASRTWFVWWTIVLGVSRRAFHQHWPTKEEFINDAVLYVVAFRDKPEGEFYPFIGRLPSLARIRFGDAVVSLARELLR